jgi:hypothetical protein
MLYYINGMKFSNINVKKFKLCLKFQIILNITFNIKILIDKYKEIMIKLCL